MTQPVLQADETPLQILDTQKGKAKKGYLWAYVSAAGSGRDIVVYACRPGLPGFVISLKPLLSGFGFFLSG